MGPQVDRFAAEPDFVNPEGVKWWRVHGDVWAVELVDGTREYVGLMGGEIATHGTQLDAVALHLDMLAAAASSDELV